MPSNGELSGFQLERPAGVEGALPVLTTTVVEGPTRRDSPSKLRTEGEPSVTPTPGLGRVSSPVPTQTPSHAALVPGVRISRHRPGLPPGRVSRTGRAARGPRHGAHPTRSPCRPPSPPHSPTPDFYPAERRLHHLPERPATPPRPRSVTGDETGLETERGLRPLAARDRTVSTTSVGRHMGESPVWTRGLAPRLSESFFVAFTPRADGPVDSRWASAASQQRSAVDDDREVVREDDQPRGDEAADP
jgi:hypothetical protein